MKKILLIIIFLVPPTCYGQDSTEIKQEVFVSLGKFALLTTNGELYDNVIHGDIDFINRNKTIEFNRALEKRKPIKILEVKCKF